MDLPLIALLVLVVAVLLRRAITRERREYARFRRLKSTRMRQRTMRRWLVDGVVVFGGLAVVVLVAVWPRVDDVLAEARAWGPFGWTVEALGSVGATWLAIGIAAVLVALLTVPVFLVRPGEFDEVPTVGGIRALLPRTRGELPWGAGLALHAGVDEELLFRLALPVLVVGATGAPAWVGFVASALLFGALHRYQGRVGMLVSAVLGLLFAALYVLSGSIVLVIVLHAVIDLRALVLVPVRLQGVHRVVR